MSTLTKTKKQFTFAYVGKAFGVFLCAFALLLGFAPWSRLYPLAVPSAFLFGLAGSYGVPLIIAALGVSLLLNRQTALSVGRRVLSILLLIFGAALLLSSFSYKTGDNFMDSFNAANSYSSHRLLGYDIKLGGGIVGFGIIEAVSGAGRWLGFLISGIVLVIAIVIFAWPYLKKFVSFIGAKSAIYQAKKQSAIEEEEQLREQSIATVSQAVEDGSFQDDDDEEDEEESEETDEDFLFPDEDTPARLPRQDIVFVPASKTTLPTQKAMRRNSENDLEEYDTDPHPSLPREMPNQPSASYSGKEISHIGLREAVFDPIGGISPAEPTAQNEVEEPLQATPISAPKPAEFSFDVASENPQESADSAPSTPVPQAEKEETPVVSYAPNFGEDDDFVANPISTSASVVPPAFEESEPIDAFGGELEANDYAVASAMPQSQPILKTPIAEPDPTPVAQQTSTPAPEAPTPVAPAPQKAPAPVPEPEPEPEQPADDGVDQPMAQPLPPYTLPNMSLLDPLSTMENMEAMEEECQQRVQIINETLSDLKAGAQVTGYTIGPSVTRFAIQPDRNVSIASLKNYLKDIEARLGGIPGRFAERVAGMTSAAVEIANSNRRIVAYRELLEKLPTGPKDNLLVPFGEDISGNVKFADLSKFPHMLIAGTTGSGKSVFIHGLVMTLLMRNRPEDLKLVLVDPKRVEMSMYRDIPHLLCPIIKEPAEAKNCLKKLCEEMDRRYTCFENAYVSDIRSFNNGYCATSGKQKMPFIVAVIDEYADLVGSAKEIQDYVLRIAQKARAAGIHLIIATQRPDVKVITGTIKSNLPVRVALTVANTTDSVTILGQGGAEDLAGYGDMLVDCSLIARNEIVRLQGCLLSDRELRVIPDFIRKQMKPQYDPAFLNLADESDAGVEISNGSGSTPVVLDAVAMKNAGAEEKYQLIKQAVMAREYCSISQIQRDYGVGFPRAGKIFARLQQEGIVASATDAPNSSKGMPVIMHELPPEDAGSNE